MFGESLASLLFQESLDVRKHVLRLNVMRVELDELPLSIEKVLREVPLDLNRGSLQLQVLVQRGDVGSLDVNFREKREGDGEL